MVIPRYLSVYRSPIKYNPKLTLTCEQNPFKFFIRIHRIVLPSSSERKLRKMYSQLSELSDSTWSLMFGWLVKRMKRERQKKRKCKNGHTLSHMITDTLQIGFESYEACWKSDKRIFTMRLQLSKTNLHIHHFFLSTSNVPACDVCSFSLPFFEGAFNIFAENLLPPPTLYMHEHSIP